MTSRSRGGEGVTQCVTNSTDRLRECVTKGGRGSKMLKILRDVIYGWSLTGVTASLAARNSRNLLIQELRPL